MKKAHHHHLLALIAGLSLLAMGPFGGCTCRNPVGPDMAPTPIPPTPTPAPTLIKKWYDGEPGGMSLAAGGSAWASPASPANPCSSFAEIPAAAYGGTKGLRLHLAWPSGGWYGGVGWNWANYNPAKAIDTRPYTHLELWIRGAVGGESGISLNLVDALNRASPTLAIAPWLPSVSNGWQRLQIPLASINFGTADPSKIWDIDFSSGYASAGDITFDVDEARFAKY